MKKTLKVILVVLFTILGFLHSNGYTIAYAQSYSYTPIMEESQDLKAQAAQLLKTNNSYNNDNPKTDEYINNFVETTWEEATLEGVRADAAFSLMMLETGWLKFGGRVSPDDHNFGGIGATDSGGTPAKFADDREGIKAVVQHLKAYACSAPLQSDCVDPRFGYVKRGCAEYIEWLGIQENPEGRGWATGFGYGFKIINIMNQMIENPLTPIITNLTATCSNSTYSITAAGIYASGALYKFTSIDTATGRESLIQSYSQNNKADWKPDNDGNYKIKAYIKTPSSPNEFDAYTTFNVTVTEAIPTTIESIKVNDTNVYEGTPFTATVTASSKNKPLYMFWIGEQISAGKYVWTLVRDYSENNTAAYTVNKPGTFRLSVYVKDSKSSKDVDVLKQCDVTVKATPTTIESIKVNDTNVYEGTPFTATVTASSKNKPLYMFWIGEQISAGKYVWTLVQNYSENNTATYRVNKPGTFRLSVYVKDSKSSKDVDVLKQCDVTVKASPTTIESIKVNDTNVYDGIPFTATVTASSKNKPLYMFWIGEQISAGKYVWTLVRDYSENNTAAYTVNKPGTFRLSVYVKDSKSSKDVEVLKQCDVTVQASPTAIGSITVNETNVKTGIPFTATVIASSPNKPLYMFWIGEQSSPGKYVWTLVRGYGENNTAAYTVNKPGTFRLSVYVKDSKSSKDVEVLKQCDVTVTGKLIFTVVLDAGHGGIDPGAVSSTATGSLTEADLNEQQTRILGELLGGYGVNVVYTRDIIPTRDNSISVSQDLQNRVDVANSLGADLFLSIHHDSGYPNTAANGVSTHYSTYRPLVESDGVYEKDGIKYDATPCEAAVKSANLAKNLLSAITGLGFNNRGASDHNLYVTRNTTMPSVLIEAGFMSNDAEVRRVASKEVQQSIAQKIAETILNFFNL